MSSFYLSNGTKADNLVELAFMLDNMSAEDFHHHVNTQKNDFSEWIKHTLKQPELAEKVRNIQNKAAFAAEIRDFLNSKKESRPAPKHESKPEPKHEPEQKQEVHDSKSAKESAMSTGHDGRTKLHNFDVKDFVYGIIFGLVLGIILTLLFS